MDMSNSSTVVAPTRISSGRALFLGLTLLFVGSLGFYHIPGMISEEAKGRRPINALYCAVITLTTIGYGDICPGSMTLPGTTFMMCYILCGLAMFGGVLEVSGAWHARVPGGSITLLLLIVGIGSALFTFIEGLSQTEAIYASIVTGTTIGYGDRTPSTDLGKISIALYAILVVNAMAIVLAPGRVYFERFCRVQITDGTEINKNIGQKKKR